MTSSVEVIAEPGNPATAASYGHRKRPLQARRALNVALGRGAFGGSPARSTSPPMPWTTSSSPGNSFEVDGNDHTASGSLVPGGIAMPGVSTRNDSVTNQVKTLSAAANSTMLPASVSARALSPERQTTGGPGVSDLDQIAANFSTFPRSPRSAAHTQRQPDLRHRRRPPDHPLDEPDVTLNGNGKVLVS